MVELPGSRPPGHEIRDRRVDACNSGRAGVEPTRSVLETNPLSGALPSRARTNLAVDKRLLSRDELRAKRTRHDRVELGIGLVLHDGVASCAMIDC